MNVSFPIQARRLITRASLGFLCFASLAYGEDETPDVKAAIPPSILALGAPTVFEFKGGLQMAVMSASEKAQLHVNQGLNHLHGGWETEAARHFAVAMQEDPECLLAHWGMVMSLLTPSPETGPARNAATDRILTLIEAGKGSELERGYAFGLLKYIEEGPKGAAAAFAKVARQFPNDIQAPMFEALFSRGGFDDFGDPTPDQDRSERMLKALIDKRPDDPLALNALLTIRSDGGDLRGHLDMARKLSSMQPDYAPYLHVLGHYEWRCGNHAAAAAAFGRACELYQNWMKANKVGVEDCEDWVRTEAYRIVALSSRGRYEDAAAAARELAAIKIADGRVQSAGSRALWWEGRTLPARLLLRRGYRGTAAEAQASLPPAKDVRANIERTLAGWWIDGLRIAMEARRLMDAGKFEEARQAAAALTLHGERMAKTQKAASMGGERSAWNRGFRGLEIIAAETRGLLAMAGPEDRRGIGFNWFRGAVDRQIPATMMYPPAVLTPMAARLGDFHLMEKKPEAAVAAFEEALKAFPNDMSALVGLLDAASAAGDDAKVEATMQAIEQVRGP
jgi:tetratricopeptide (TPR) repeat protein